MLKPKLQPKSAPGFTRLLILFKMIIVACIKSCFQCRLQSPIKGHERPLMISKKFCMARSASDFHLVFLWKCQMWRMSAHWLNTFSSNQQLTLVALWNILDSISIAIVRSYFLFKHEDAFHIIMLKQTCATCAYFYFFASWLIKWIRFQHE